MTDEEQLEEQAATALWNLHYQAGWRRGFLTALLLCASAFFVILAVLSIIGTYIQVGK